MLFAIVALDKPGSLELRLKIRPDHLAYMDASGVTWAYAGPIMTEDGKSPHGSLMIGEFESLEAARAFNQNDPYSKGGLFGSVTVQPTVKVRPT